jgi:diacylglycerol kinase (ATP)
MSQSTLVIYNPVAGRGRVREYWPRVEQALREANVDFEAIATEEPIHALRIAEAEARKRKAIVAVGGDGTVHEVVNGLLRASHEKETISLGVIGLGNGDDFAKMIPPETAVGCQPDDWRAAVARIAAGKTALFDAVRITGDAMLPESLGNIRYFVNGMDLGFGALTSLNFKKIPKFLTGKAGYLAAVFKTMLAYNLPRVRLQFDDEPPFEKKTTMTVVMNGRCFGSCFWVCPEARADDGLLDVMVTEPIGRLTILKMVPKLMKATHMQEPVVRFYKARRVLIESAEPFAVEADGEIPALAARRLEVELLPQRLRVMV